MGEAAITVMAELAVEQRYYPAIFVARVINWIAGIIELALALRLLLELFGANSASQFVAWVYGVTSVILGPFAGAFPNLSLGGSSIVDVVTIMAMIGYAILGWILIQFLSLIFVTISRM